MNAPAERTIEAKATADAHAFVEGWLNAWREHDGHAYAALLHEDCVLNPFRMMGPGDLPEFIYGVDTQRQAPVVHGE